MAVVFVLADGGLVRGLPHSEAAPAAPRSAGLREGQHLLQAAPGAIQTPQQVIWDPTGQHMTTSPSSLHSAPRPRPWTLAPATASAPPPILIIIQEPDLFTNRTI